MVTVLLKNLEISWKSSPPIFSISGLLPLGYYSWRHRNNGTLRLLLQPYSSKLPGTLRIGTRTRRSPSSTISSIRGNALEFYHEEETIFFSEFDDGSVMDILVVILQSLLMPFRIPLVLLCLIMNRMLWSRQMPRSFLLFSFLLVPIILYYSSIPGTFWFHYRKSRVSGKPMGPGTLRRLTKFSVTPLPSVWLWDSPNNRGWYLFLSGRWLA